MSLRSLAFLFSLQSVAIWYNKAGTVGQAPAHLHLAARFESFQGYLSACCYVPQRLAQSPRRAVDLFGALFARKIGPELLGMAKDYSTLFRIS